MNKIDKINAKFSCARFGILLLSILILMLFIYSFFRIRGEVKTACLKAQAEYHEDCVNSLIEYIQSNNHTIRNRNSAVWALGQIADKKALPFLYGLNKTLPEQEKCSYDDCLSKYEIQKAIRWCEKENITNWIYKNRDNWH